MPDDQGRQAEPSGQGDSFAPGPLSRSWLVSAEFLQLLLARDADLFGQLVILTAHGPSLAGQLGEPVPPRLALAHLKPTDEMVALEILAQAILAICDRPLLPLRSAILSTDQAPGPTAADAALNALGHAGLLISDSENFSPILKAEVTTAVWQARTYLPPEQLDWRRLTSSSQDEMARLLNLVAVSSIARSEAAHLAARSPGRLFRYWWRRSLRQHLSASHRALEAADRAMKSVYFHLANAANQKADHQSQSEPSLESEPTRIIGRPVQSRTPSVGRWSERRGAEVFGDAWVDVHLHVERSLASQRDLSLHRLISRLSALPVWVNLVLIGSRRLRRRNPPTARSVLASGIGETTSNVNDVLDLLGPPPDLDGSSIGPSPQTPAGVS